MRAKDFMFWSIGGLAAVYAFAEVVRMVYSLFCLTFVQEIIRFLFN